MKKFKMSRLFIAVVMVMTSVMMLAGCGKSDKMVGTWKAKTIEVSGTEMKIDDAAKMSGQTMEMTFEFKKGGKVTVNVESNGQEEKGDGTYKLEDDKVTIESKSWLGQSKEEDIKFNVKGDKFSIDMDGIKVGFVREK